MSSRRVKVYRRLLEENADWAEKSRALLRDNGATMINIIGSPGCGKTALLEATRRHGAEMPSLAVLEGDVETTRDADRLAALGVRVSQIITEGACHLDAQVIFRALTELPLEELELVVVENVGNLVCPAGFDLGENAKVAVLSVTEGEDKPLKYPLLFREAGLVVVTKTDLLAHLDFDLKMCLDSVRRVNGSVPIIRTSSKTGEGMDEWCDWLVRTGK